MRVYHVIAGLNDGGAEAVLYRLCVNDKSNAHHVISMMDEGKYGSLLKTAGVAVTCLDMPRSRLTIRGLWRLWRLMRVEQPDVVQTWMYHADLVGGVVARLAGVKHVLWNIRHTTLDPLRSKRSTTMVTWLCARLSHWVPQAIVCCAYRSAEIHSDLGYATEKLLVIPNGFDLNHFVANDDVRMRLRAEWGVSNRWLVGMIGRFDPQKDHKNLLKALSGLKRRGIDFLVVLVGSGLDASNTQITRRLEEFELIGQVRLLGQRTDIADVMNALDLHVLSSAFGEAFPNVVAEAMACETPAVVTDVGDAAVIVGDTGWVVPPGNSNALANAMIQAREAMNDVDAWKVRGAAARKRIEGNFSLSRMVTRYNALWRHGML